MCYKAVDVTNTAYSQKGDSSWLCCLFDFRQGCNLREIFCSHKGKTRLSVSSRDSVIGNRFGEIWARNITSPSQVDEFRIVYLCCFCFVETLECAIMPFVDSPSTFNRNPHQFEFVEHDSHGDDGATMCRYPFVGELT